MSDKLESLYRIKIEAQLLQNNRSSPDIGEVLAVQAEIDRLVELFYAECRGLVGTEEYHQARGISIVFCA
jgi:hypothetical protein